MKVREMLKSGGILVPLDAPDLRWALSNAFRAIPSVPDELANKLTADLLDSVSGEIHRVHERVTVALAESEAVESTCAVIGVSPSAFSGEESEAQSHEVTPGAGVEAPSDDQRRPEALLLLVTPGRFIALRERALPALKRFFREEERVAPLLNARTVDAVERVNGLMELELHQSLLVEDVVEPIQYRVYPDTPYSEVADLMIRRALNAVPVVGEDYEFLGVVTTGDAVREVVSRARVQESVGGSPVAPLAEPTAREIMTRAVMCVSEDQSLMEAASIMVNRDVEQLPVVRDGEVVGLLTRGEVLRWLFPGTSPK
jgi:CBS domain-containing protein